MHTRATLEMQVLTCVRSTTIYATNMSACLSRARSDKGPARLIRCHSTQRWHCVMSVLELTGLAMHDGSHNKSANWSLVVLHR